MNKHPTPPIIDAIFKIAIICAIIKILIYGFDLYSSYPPFINYVYMKAINYFYKKPIRLIIIYSIEFFILPQLYEIIATRASLKKKKRQHTPEPAHQILSHQTSGDAGRQNSAGKSLILSHG